jgi:hypothetical protein
MLQRKIIKRKNAAVQIFVSQDLQAWRCPFAVSRDFPDVTTKKPGAGGGAGLSITTADWEEECRRSTQADREEEE